MTHLVKNTAMIAIAVTSALASSAAIAADHNVKPSTKPELTALANPDGYTGRIRLIRFLDEPDGYCLDIPGPVDNVMLKFGANAHTCHFYPLADQVYHFNQSGKGQIRWQYQDHDVCLTAASATAGAKFKYKTCDKPEVQQFDYTDKYEFKLKNTNLCLFVEKTGVGYGEEMKEGQDAYGRGHPVNPQFTHLARALELQECGSGHEPSMYSWQAYQE